MEIDDLIEEYDPEKPGRKRQEFTDGVGTVSVQLSDMIWQKLCAGRRDGGKNAVKPSAVSVTPFSRFYSVHPLFAVSNSLLGL